MVLAVQITIVIPQLQLIDKWSMSLVSSRSFVGSKDADQGQYWVVRVIGYVRVAFCALNVKSQCLWAVVQNG